MMEEQINTLDMANKAEANMMAHRGIICMLFFILLFFKDFLAIGVLASPPWLTEGFYAKYSVYNTHFMFLNFSSPYDYKRDYNQSAFCANGTFFWKVLKIENGVALIKINFSVIGFVGIYPSVWEEKTISRSFKILVNVSDRFILNTSRTDPLYFPYWVPIGTKEDDQIFLGHQYLSNFWLIGTFWGYGMTDYIETSWKTFHASDIIFLLVTNMSGVRIVNPYIHTPPSFAALYDRGSGIMLGLTDVEPVLLKFLNIYTLDRAPYPMFGGIMLDNIGVEPVENEGSQAEHMGNVSILISTILVPTSVEAGREFEVSLTLENNGTGEARDLRILLSSLNEGAELPSPVQVESINPKGTREVTLSLTLSHEGVYDLYFEVYKDNEVLLRRSFSIECKPSLIQAVTPFVIVTIILLVSLISSFLLLRKKHW